MCVGGGGYTVFLLFCKGISSGRKINGENMTNYVQKSRNWYVKRIILGSWNKVIEIANKEKQEKSLGICWWDFKR